MEGVFGTHRVDSFTGQACRDLANAQCNKAPPRARHRRPPRIPAPRRNPPGLRGRLREADQIRARPGIPLPLEVRYDDYTADIPENRTLRGAAIRLLTLTNMPAPVRMALIRLDRALADAAPLRPGTPAPEITLTRLNRRYGPALQLARLILERTSVEHRPGQTGSNGFLFDMNHVYEDWLTQALTRSLQAHGGTVRRQQPLTLDHTGQTVMHTDITWWSGADCLAVIDAKYKRLPPPGPRPEDLYQILAYCTALGIRSGHLVYAAGTPHLRSWSATPTSTSTHTSCH
jgi:5-methylcytosine-specific restriction enzyme subunit McrC